MGAALLNKNKRVGLRVLAPEVTELIDKKASQADLSYPHPQIPPEKVWVVHHNLGKYPSVTVVDTAGNVVYGDVQHLDQYNLTITFSCAFSGYAYCN